MATPPENGAPEDGAPEDGAPENGAPENGAPENGAPDLPGAAVLAAVAVMDRLRSPGGCPWDAAQTHRSLAPYLLEETYEVLEAIDAEDPVLLREELGDLLLQVLFHARLAQELPAGQRFSVDDVAADLVAKLLRRHPHVFATGSDAPADTVDVVQVQANWEQLKQAEKQRRSLTQGIPTAQPALAFAAKLVSRVRRAGLDVAEPTDSGVGAQLFALVVEAVVAGIDPEQELRCTARAYADGVRTRES